MIPSHTLSRYVRGEERKHWGATGELSDLLSAIALAVKMISHLVATAGFKGLSGYTGATNIHNNTVSKLDQESHKILVDTLGTSGYFGLLVSEEHPEVIQSPLGYDLGKYVVAFDPLDGSGNIGVNVPVGTIFGIYKKLNLHAPAVKEDFLQAGNQLVAAGYAVYGARTSFVYSCGDGVHGFTLDSTIGEFMLTDDRIICPPRGTIYSVNEGNTELWHKGVQAYVAHVKSEEKNGGLGYSGRYVGSMVCDLDRILRKGGVFLYPADTEKPQGKLRLLYECIPLAFLIEQAGGRATDGTSGGRTLDKVPTNIHERSGLVAGGAYEVGLFEEFLRLSSMSKESGKRSASTPMRR
jgi:fructose-1,6-bisphosphatase I